MTLQELLELLEIAQKNNCECLVATTPHGSYSFDVTDVEIGLMSGNVVLRLTPIEED